MHSKISLVLSFMFCTLGSSYAQQNNEDLYTFFDQTVGIENTLLFNGVENIDLQRTIDEDNKYLLPGREFVNGSLVYDKQFFAKVPMRFNLVDNDVIVNLSKGQENSVFKLIKEKIERFTLDGREFVFIGEQPNSDISKGFYQDLYESGDFRVFKKYLKREFKMLDRSNPYYRYEFLDPEYYLLYENSYYEIDSRNDLADLFPSLKKEIRSFFKDNKQLKKTDSDKFMFRLFAEMTRLTNQEKI